MSKKQSNPKPDGIKKPPPPPAPPPKRLIREDGWGRPKGAGPYKFNKHGLAKTNREPLPPNARSATGYRSLWCICGFHKLENTEPELGIWGRFRCVRDGCNYATLGISEMWPGMPAPPKPEEVKKKLREKCRCPVLKCCVRLDGWCSFWHNGYCGFHGREMKKV